MEIIVLHYSLHFLFPLIAALLFFKNNWKIAFITMLFTMVVDLDHLMANPIYDASRCSIGFHPLHSYWAIVIYIVLMLPKKTRIIALGLILHMITDYIDCVT